MGEYDCASIAIYNAKHWTHIRILVADFSFLVAMTQVLVQTCPQTLVCLSWLQWNQKGVA